MTGQLRLVLRLAALVVTLLAALPLHGAWRVARRPSPWPRLFLGAVGRIVGARARSLGTPLRRDVLFLANHLSWIDILILAGVTGTAFVAKGELARVPLVGWLCRLNGTLFVSRENRLQITEQIAALRAALAGGQGVAIFPEGTTGDGITLLPFKPALLAVLEPPSPGLRVQPVRIDYGDATADCAWIGDEPGASHALRVLRRRGSFVATLRFCEPFDPAGFPGRKAIAAETRRRIEAAASDAR